MVILSIDQSSPKSSVALVDGGKVICAKQWTESREKPQQLFPLLRDMLIETSIDKVELLTVGLGPGSYSGMRMSLSAFNGLALPAKKQVYGVASADALIRAVSAANGGMDVTLVGNARKHCIWIIRGNSASAEAAEISHLKITSPLELEGLAAGSLIISYDWVDMEKTGLIRSPGMKIDSTDQPADAVQVAQLAAIRISRNIPSLPLSPIYVHPAVIPQFSPPSEN